jgi:nucleoside triphosphate pyrophosphatase
VTAPPLVLASASPRRLELLRQIGIVPDRVDPAAIDEGLHRDEEPAAHALRLAEEKLRAVMPRHPDAYILAADTVVACGRRILPKPADEAAARRCLELLSGRRHRVHSGIALSSPDGRLALRRVASQVAFKRLSADEVAVYLASGEWRGKAGGYAIQGRAAAMIRFVSGSYSNVVGLPLFETAQLLAGRGYRARCAASS